MEPIVDVLWSCIAMMKDVYNSLWYEGINEACKEFEDAMDELLVSVSIQGVWCV